MPTEFKLTVPETTAEEKSYRFRNFTSPGEAIKTYYIGAQIQGDYVGEFRYGPMYNSKGKMLSETDLYNVKYFADWIQEDGSTERKGFNGSNKKGNYYYTLKPFFWGTE